MTAEQFKAAYNAHFFPDGQLNPAATATITLTVTLNGQSFTLPELEATPHTRLHDIATWFAALPVDLHSPEDSPHPQPSEPAPPKRTLEAIQHIDYRNTEYLLQHLREEGQDRFVIQNRKTGRFIGAGTVTGRSILKVYRNYSSEEEE
ncbi:MAG: hypothetical protein H6566_08795 [Lewinellaceae bacterium]|nr:hypothetical protein [Lewinellaceae bacterium]